MADPDRAWAKEERGGGCFACPAGFSSFCNFGKNKGGPSSRSTTEAYMGLHDLRYGNLAATSTSMDSHQLVAYNSIWFQYRVSPRRTQLYPVNG